MIAALDAFADQPFGQPRETRPAFRAFARIEDEGGEGDVRHRQRGAERDQIMIGDMRVGDDHRPRALQQRRDMRSEEHTSELQSLMRISYAVFCLKNKKKYDNIIKGTTTHVNRT